MANIKFNSTRVREVANNTKTRVDSINEKLKRMNTLIEQVQTAWQGEDSTAYITKLTTSSKNIETLVKTLEELPGALTKIANEMDELQKANASAASL